MLKLCMWPLLIVSQVMSNMRPASAASKAIEAEVLLKVWTFCMASVASIGKLWTSESSFSPEASQYLPKAADCELNYTSMHEWRVPRNNNKKVSDKVNRVQLQTFLQSGFCSKNFSPPLMFTIHFLPVLIANVASSSQQQNFSRLFVITLVLSEFFSTCRSRVTFFPHCESTFAWVANDGLGDSTRITKCKVA